MRDLVLDDHNSAKNMQVLKWAMTGTAPNEPDT
jgi:hypothetical protein